MPASERLLQPLSGASWISSRRGSFLPPLLPKESGSLAARYVCPRRALWSVWPSFFQKYAHGEIKQGLSKVFAEPAMLISSSVVVSSAGVDIWSCYHTTVSTGSRGYSAIHQKAKRIILACLGLWMFPSCNFPPSFLMCVLISIVCCSKYDLLFFLRVICNS